MYAIVDIETTGSSLRDSKITEIAIYLHDGKKIVDEFVSLVNPECRIPSAITSFTGISDEMVAHAPTFPQIAKKVIELTENAIFVAHNSSFDYSIVKNEYKSLGYNYRRNTLCTVRLSRKLIPGKRSYSLGNLCNNLGIEIKNRHRAAGDALATVQLFELLLQKQTSEIPFEENLIVDTHSIKLHPNISPEIIENLPEYAGVYYFYNKLGEIIYVGKSKNIRQRILSHFSSSKTNKSLKIKNFTCDIKYQNTGSELLALLLESDEIKRLQPIYNSALKRTRYTWGIFKGKDEHGYLTLEVDRIKNRQKEHPINVSNSVRSANSMLTDLARKYGLCPKLCNLEKSNGPCFYYQLKLCNGACIQAESAEKYNKKALQIIQKFEYDKSNFIVIDRGKTEEEKSVVLIENGKYMGFGFVSVDEGIKDIEQLKDVIKPYQDNKDTTKIIRGYLKRNKVEKIIEF